MKDSRTYSFRSEEGTSDLPGCLQINQALMFGRPVRTKLSVVRFINESNISFQEGVWWASPNQPTRYKDFQNSTQIQRPERIFFITTSNEVNVVSQ
jgi:hypothetical protein